MVASRWRPRPGTCSGVGDACSDRNQKGARVIELLFGCQRLVAVARGSLAAEAVAAVDRLRATGAEGDLGLAAAARARGAEHLARAARIAFRTTAARVSAAAVAASGLLGCAARRATSRLAELTVCVELLLTRGERELLIAVRANERLVLSVQKKTPSRAAPANFLAETDERECRVPLLSTPISAPCKHYTTPVAGCERMFARIFDPPCRRRVQFGSTR